MPRGRKEEEREAGMSTDVRKILELEVKVRGRASNISLSLR